MSGSGVKKVADLAVKAGKAIDWDGMAKMLVSEEARKEFATLRRTFEDVNNQLQTNFSQEPKPIDWVYYRKGIGAKVVDLYKEAYDNTARGRPKCRLMDSCRDTGPQPRIPVTHHAPRGMAAVRVVAPRLRSIPLLLPGQVHHSCSCRSSAAASARTMSSSSASSSPSPYTALVGRVRCEREIKRSKFIAIAGTVPDERAAMSFLDEVKDPRATHNCWAYKVGEQFRYNDDGEPSSTAGKPIYSAIISSGIDIPSLLFMSMIVNDILEA